MNVHGMLRSTLLLVTLALVGNGTAADEHDERPDFSGYWMPNVGQSVGWPFDGPPFTEHGRALWDAYVTDFDRDLDDPARLCVPEAMPRSMIQPPFPIELIHRDHDITLFFEAWSQYRKIFMVDHDHPEPVLHTRMGHAVAHWDGDTLVIHTTHLQEREMGKILFSDQARMEERMRLEVSEAGTKRLINDLTFIDDITYSRPVTMRGVWDYSPETPILEYVCSEEVWDLYIDALRATGERIF